MLTKVLALISILAVATAQVPPPTCYQGGAGPASGCTQFIGNFCDDVAKDQFRIGDNGARCFNLPNGNRCDFIAFNSRNINTGPSATNCRTVLNNIARQCRAGGFGQIGPNAFTFTVDPNTGRCSQNVQPGS